MLMAAHTALYRLTVSQDAASAAAYIFCSADETEISQLSLLYMADMAAASISHDI